LSSENDPIRSNKVAELITIVYNTNDANASIANLLNVQIKETGKYEPVIKTQAEYEISRFENELLGKVSDKPIIFVSNINSQLSEKISWAYNEYGMKYGWQGKQAVLLVEKRKWNEVELVELNNLLNQSQEVKPKEDIKNRIDKVSSKVNKLPAGLKIAGAAAGGAIFGLAAAAAAGGAFLINNKINTNKLLENQRKYLVDRFITMSISDFME
jgi:hypothetical protein